MGGLVADAAGNLYGTTNGGGAPAFGLVYELSPPAGGGRLWTQTILHTFPEGAEAQSYAGLIGTHAAATSRHDRAGRSRLGDAA